MSTQVKFTVVVMGLNLPFSFAKDELLLILNLSSPSLHLHELICLPVSQTSKHNKLTFYFIKELRRPRSEDANGATLSQPKCKLGTPWMQNKDGSLEQITLISPRQTNQETINGCEFSMRSEEFLCCHVSALVDPQHASFAQFKFCRVCQTSKKIPLPWLALILNSQKQYCIKSN